MKPGEGVRCDWKGSRIGRSVTLPPPPRRRDSRRNSNTALGALEASGTWRPDRWPPGQCSMAGPGTREAMVDPGTLAALADQGALETMAELETWPLFFLVGQGVPWPWLCARPPRQRL